MKAIRSVILTLVLTAGLTLPGLAQTQQSSQNPPPTQQGQAQTLPDVEYKETVIVSASKTEQQLINAPATITVITSRALFLAPSNNYADLLRTVPGVNITQISARDVNVTSRGAASSLATSQLAVVDGRSIYQDFFGFTMWDFMPANLDEIKQIEAIRGPASAIWGANALNGVVNVITKSPREMEGSTLTFGIGGFGRDVNNTVAPSGSIFYVRGTHALAVNDRWAYKVSAGTSSMDALARPTGIIPGSRTAYPAYANTGTTQPKFDGRVDYDFPDGDRRLSFSGGIAATDGIMHSGIGPFDIEDGTKYGYWKADFTRQAFKLQAFMNILDGNAANLVSVGPTGKPISFVFKTKTFDVEIGDTRLAAERHVFTYGGNLRLNRFNLSIAPGETSRTEGGAYLQDEIILSEQFRVVAGARVDKFSSIDKMVFSPRVAVVMKPRDDKSIRVSYNRAFRAPSMINNNLDTTIANPLPLGLVHPAFGTAVYLVPTRARGNPNLTEEHIDAFEVGFSGTIGDRATASATWYYNRFSEQIFFTQSGTWLAPPPGFPGLPGAPPEILWAGLYAANVRFPSDFTYLNLGKVVNKGIELGLEGMVSTEIRAFANYAFQADPVPDFPNFTRAEALTEINIPAKHLVNVGVSYLGPRAFGSLSVSRSGSAFWQDVLDSRFHGFTDSYAIVNLTLGARSADDRYTATLKFTNIGNQQVQQHIFGDVMRRSVVAEMKIKLPK